VALQVWFLTKESNHGLLSKINQSELVNGTPKTPSSASSNSTSADYPKANITGITLPHRPLVWGDWNFIVSTIINHINVMPTGKKNMLIIISKTKLAYNRHPRMARRTRRRIRRPVRSNLGRFRRLCRQNEGKG
jgi:hypothetical protein